MRKFGLAILVLFGAFGATGCRPSGSGEVEMVGQLRLERRLPLTDALGRRRELVPGPARLTFSPGVPGLRPARLLIEDSRGERIKVAMPDSLLDSRVARWSAAQLGQTFGLRLIRRESAIEQEAQGGCRLAVSLRVLLVDARDAALGEFIEDGEHEVRAPAGERCRR